MIKGRVTVVAEHEETYLTEAEHTAIESHGTYHQAMAIRSFELLMQQPDTTVEAIRQLDAKTVRKVQKHLAKAVGAIGLPIEPLQAPLAVADTDKVELAQPTIVETPEEIAGEPDIPFVDTVEAVEEAIIPKAVPRPKSVRAPRVEDASKEEPLTLQQRRLQAFTKKDIREVDLSHADLIASVLVSLYDRAYPSRNRKIDYLQAVTMFIAGESLARIAGKQNTSIESMRMTLKNIFDKLQRAVPDDFDFAIEPAPKEELEEPSAIIAPKPRPVAPAVALVSPVVESKREGASYDEIIPNALDIKKSGLVTPAEWRRVAEEKLREVAKEHLSPEQIEGLWARVHTDLYDNHQVYKKPVSDEQRVVLDVLGLRLRDRLSVMTAFENNLQLSALRPFVNTTMGVQDLDRVHYLLRSKNKAITMELAQRYLVDGIVKILA